MGRTVWLLLSLLAASHVCEAAKILLVFPVPGKSHGILGAGVLKHLLNAGHEVTFITAFPKNSTNPNLHEIDVSANSNINLAQADFMNFEAILQGKVDNSDQTNFLFFFNMLSTMTLENENVQKLLKDRTQHFDVIIAEWMFNELYAGLQGVFNAPLIWFSTIEPHWMILSLIDDYTNPSYNGYIAAGSPPFTFRERLEELYFTLKMGFVRETAAYNLQISAYNSIYVPIMEAKGRETPPFSVLRYNASLVLGNSHVSMGQATRLPQNYIPVGGYHIDEEVKPLPEDLKKLLDNAKNGLIYFSMGSNLQSKNLPDKLKKSLLEMLGTLKHTVLWKFEEKFPKLPENVHIIDWAPQQSILAHPNCVLFITHGGLLSTTETLYAGKPVIGIPVFADQFVNVARAVEKGFARKVDLSYTMADKLKIEVEEILSNPKYTQKAKELSFVYHDRLATPGKELVHWVNHVVKTNGAPHLRSAALLLPWYQKYYLDLAAIIIIALILLMIVIKKMFSLIRPKKIDRSKKNK